MAMRLALLCTAGGASVRASRSDELNFLVMGDWGGQGSSPHTTPEEVSTARAMNDAAAELGAEFALALGDNFYSWGIRGDWTDDRFRTTFEECFDGDALSNASGFEFHVLAGNHDHRGNVQAQIDYTAHSARWNFPSYYYSISKKAPDGATIDIVMLDTVKLSGNSELNDEDTGSLKGSELPGPADPVSAASQLDWLDATLRASTADYLIVAGHYPVYSIAEHGPTNNLQPSNFPYLRQHRVSAYLSGHDHSEQHIDVGDGIQYHVIGSAHGADTSTAHKGSIQSDQLKFHGTPEGGFSTISVSKSGMIVKHLDGNGEVLYTGPAIPPRDSVPRSWECRSGVVSKVGVDLDFESTGADITACEQACEMTEDCHAVYWHTSNSHCHLLTGSFTRDEWVGALKSDSSKIACYRLDGPPSPPPSATWECRHNVVSKLGTDTDLKGTGDGITSCEQACDNTANCRAVYWHKQPWSNCHVLTGGFSHEDWVADLKSDSSKIACYKLDEPMNVVV